MLFSCKQYVYLGLKIRLRSSLGLATYTRHRANDHTTEKLHIWLFYRQNSDSGPLQCSVETFNR